MAGWLIPVMGLVADILSRKSEEIGKNVGVSAESVAKIGAVVERYVTQDERAQQMLNDELERARQHDVATSAKAPPVVELLRGLVRPVVTLLAFGWYVWARAVGISLGSEDYALIGGVVAFWFGFRPFEKNAALGTAARAHGK
jgi:hypothetical protein